MSEDIGDEDSYHYDFTTASEWEIFIARLEEVIHEWKLPQLRCRPPLAKNEFFSGEWLNASEKLLFADSEFTVTRHYLKPVSVDEGDGTLDEEAAQLMMDLMSTENDFLPPLPTSSGSASAALMLARWYGLRDFLVLAPTRGETVSSESKLKILLSSILIAVNNSYCALPMFVSVHDASQVLLVGVAESGGVRTEFECVHVARIPPPCKHLTGLLAMFKSKLASPLPLEPITIAARFTFVLSDWVNCSWSRQAPELTADSLAQLPFGAVFDPISCVHLSATWSQLLDNAVVDSESYTDLEPTQAPHWSLTAVMADRPACLLGDYFLDMIQLCSSNRSMRDLLGDLLDRGGAVQMSAPLSVLTESRVPTISRVLRRGQRKPPPRVNEGPLEEQLLMTLLYFLFPDAEDNSRNIYPDFAAHDDRMPTQNQVNLSGLKSAASGSLVWRLAVAAAHLAHAHGGVKAVAHLWFEFVQEMRFRWEKTITVPGVVNGFPDPRSCLLHQKLQLLNCCIARKIAREQAVRTEPDSSDSADSEEEFFDCSGDEVEGDDVGPRSSTRKKAKHSLWNQPVGRLRRHGNLRLVDTGDQLYIPVTQEPTPKTEDQVQEDAEVLLQLGCDAQGSELRARMMSAALLSDMESFKAANPGALIEDFIRWYSPRDWLELEGTDQYGQTKGVLSARMQIPGNAWTEAWTAAKPVPARRQKRLFDDTREAEKVLHFLESQRPAGVAQLLLPVVAHAALARLAEELGEAGELPGGATLQNMVKMAERLTRSPQPHVSKYEDLSAEVVVMETTVSQLRSLEHKFADRAALMDPALLRRFLMDLMTLPEVEVIGGARGHLRSRIHTMFADAQKVAKMLSEHEPMTSSEEQFSSTHSSFPRPSSREFLLRVVARRPAPCSAPTPQRMYATLKPNEFRLVGAFSHDTTFL